MGNEKSKVDYKTLATEKTSYIVIKYEVKSRASDYMTYGYIVDKVLAGPPDEMSKEFLKIKEEPLAFVRKYYTEDCKVKLVCIDSVTLYHVDRLEQI